MWTDAKTIAHAVGLTVRTVQLRAKKEFQIRKKDGKSIEIYVPSLPPDWQTKLAKAGAIVPVSQMLSSLTPSAQVIVQSKLSLGKLTDTQRKRLAIATQFKQKPTGMKKAEWVRSLASLHDVSETSVYRIAKEAETGILLDKSQGLNRTSAFDPEASAYIKGYWLQAIREVGECSKQTAWKALQLKAVQEGWKIGSRSSAFNLLGKVDHLLVAYARGGNRALDNYFYITRDADALLPFQIVIGDQHIFDWWVADYEAGEIRRPQCYLWLDMCTKLIYGIAFDKTYSSDTVKESLRLGLYRFGAFDCTYNDNGSSECSKAINSIIDDLLQLQMNAADMSDLYKTPEGIFVVTNEDGDVLDTARSPEEWRRKHRRIFANVRNAKAKDIERFFRTLEKRLEGRMLPGRVATPGATAAVDEAERARLEKQKNHHELLTQEEFMLVVVEELQAYENNIHATLGMAPLQKLEQKFRAGWQPRFFEHEVVDLILFERVRRKVERGRVLVDGVQFIGEDLRTENGLLADVGLWRHDGKTVEIRYNKHNLDYAYAVIDNSVRPLKAVQAVEMLDDEKMVQAISQKRQQMAAVREAFKRLTAPIGGVVLKSPMGPALKRAQVIQNELPDLSNEEFKKQVEEQERMARAVVAFPVLHASRHERYQWCLDQIALGNKLSQQDCDFLQSYEASEEYKKNETYWITYKKLAGGAK
ncbi:transposase domain-containing protein [Parasphaerochaeta coccoides]|uniref:Bacteriophage Mu transposase domain-containing protein n=1 Tax=Parasphaerochaeta coccoides (strain ATCC BAA-1237 / DSM 17374 / SPN1) TaxID=760011 RepID=F4GHU4_PARC1|nr:transposase domain-containing protein [Parasphaerochaeta coccoides]AEC02057.1 hypothetical protein Spico_0833 [Parasphaerochaeta coccoides DSM 17374]